MSKTNKTFGRGKTASFAEIIKSLLSERTLEYKPVWIYPNRKNKKRM